MKLFSVPADFRNDTIDKLAELNSRHEDAAVGETYGQATTGGFSGSGRNYRLLPDVDLGQLEKYVAYATSKGIDFNYTLNASCMGNSEFTGSGLRRIERFIDGLWNMGVRHFTVSMPPLMTIIKESGHPFSIKASTICQINSAYKAEYYRNFGLDRMVIDEDVTRDFRRIRQITRAFGDDVEMIINSLCIKDCPNKMFHYNHESHFSYSRQDIKTYYVHYCGAKAVADPMNIMRLNWVRPEDLQLYERAGISRYKLQGRHSALHGDLVKTVETYIEGSYDGNLYDLLFLFDPRMPKLISYYPYVDNKALDGFLTPFFENPNHCIADCEACGHCTGFAEASMGGEKNAEVLRLAREKLDKPGPFVEYHEQPPTRRLAIAIARRGNSLGHSIRQGSRRWEA